MAVDFDLRVSDNYRKGGGVTSQRLLLLLSYIFIFYQLHSVHYAGQYIFIVVLYCLVTLLCYCIVLLLSQ